MLLLTRTHARVHTPQEFHGQLPFWDALLAADDVNKRENEEPPFSAPPHVATAGRLSSGGRGVAQVPNPNPEAEAELDETERGQRALRAVVDRVRATARLKTPVGLARSALRHALHDGEL